MIIGNNNNNNNLNNQTFNNRFNNIKEESKKFESRTNTIVNCESPLQHSNVTSKNDMADKSFNMLQERFNNGLISLEEFTKKCNLLNKQRQK